MNLSNPYKNSSIILAASMAAMVASPVQGDILRAIRTADGMMTFDRATVDSAGAFLIGELEKLDPRVNMPLVEYSWSRDVKVRSDVTIADEVSSFTHSGFAAAGSPSPNGKNWIGKDSNAIRGIALTLDKVANPLTLWGMEVGYTIPELESSRQLNRPIASKKSLASI